MESHGNRAEGRANVFLGAVLDSDIGTGSVPVRVRNISPHGALIEGPILPAPGAEVRLVRGALRASGTLAWEAQSHAGVSFAEPIDVQAWVQRVGHAGQQRVDSLVAAIRRGETVRGGGDEPQADALAGISRSLDELCERLASSKHFPPELGEDLLKLDVLAQSLRGLTGRAR
jgi:hypothetical protein